MKSVPTKQPGSNTGEHQAWGELHRDLVTPQEKKSSTVVCKEWNLVVRQEIKIQGFGSVLQLNPTDANYSSGWRLLHTCFTKHCSVHTAHFKCTLYKFWILLNFLLLVNTGPSYSNVQPDLWHQNSSSLGTGLRDCLETTTNVCANKNSHHHTHTHPKKKVIKCLSPD